MEALKALPVVQTTSRLYDMICLEKKLSDDFNLIHKHLCRMTDTRLETFNLRDYSFPIICLFNVEQHIFVIMRIYTAASSIQ